MEVSYGEGLATHTGPESCAGDRVSPLRSANRRMRNLAEIDRYRCRRRCQKEQREFIAHWGRVLDAGGRFTEALLVTAKGKEGQRIK
jgi:hypothetical protein